MTSITTRAGKGTPLTHTEVDDNFTNLNADKLEASNNLSDVSSTSAARTNLGLGTAATTASTDYATAAQGALADSAVQPNDSPSFGSVTVTGTVDGRDVAADGSKLDGIEAGATADQTASEILTSIKTVDGSGSGLDADLLDGQQGSYYYPASNPNGYTSNVGDITGVTAGTGLTGGGTSGAVTLNGVTQSQATWEAGTSTTEGVVSPAKISAAISALAGGGTPASTVIYVAQNTAPTGYVKANGAALSRTTYADLFAAIGTTFGSGDGSTTFNVPDLRGEFIRAWDDARGVDSGRSFGSAQADEFESHRHIGGFPRGPAAYSGGRYGVDSSGAGAVSQQASGTYTWLYPYTSTEGGSETRPRNIALLACIKY